MIEVDLEYEREHWMGYTLKEYREKYEQLVMFAIQQQFQLKVLMETQDVRECVPTGKGKAKKRKGSD